MKYQDEIRISCWEKKAVFSEEQAFREINDVCTEWRLEEFVPKIRAIWFSSSFDYSNIGTVSYTCAKLEVEYTVNLTVVFSVLF